MNAPDLGINDLLSISQLTRAAIESLLETAMSLKSRAEKYTSALAGKSIVLLFEKDSLRTRVSFEAGMARLGGKAIYLDHRQNKIGEREPVRDYALNLERWVDAIVARTYQHSTIEELADHASVPVINALSEIEHPCQALADFLTLHERFNGLNGVKLAYIGDGNNVCHSLMLCAATLGVAMTVITPKGYEPSKNIVSQAQAIGRKSGVALLVTNDIAAVADHDAVYTDAWTSMGQEAESAARRKAFAGYQVTGEIMNKAGAGSVFMHCLPAHRGEEVAADVIDSDRSIVYDQAENRMHAQNALLLGLLGKARPGVKREGRTFVSARA